MAELEKKTFTTQEGPRNPGSKQPERPDKEKPADPPKKQD